jgi:hypothetical protein
MKTEEVGSAPLRKDMLDTKDSFILDTAQSLFVWVGKKSTKEEKNKAWDVANVRAHPPTSTQRGICTHTHSHPCTRSC